MARLLKIVHVTCGPHVRQARIFEKECRSLAADGYDVALVAPHEHCETIEGVRILPIRPVANRAVRMLLGSWRALYTALKERADIYHLHDPELLLPFQLARLTRATVIFDMHENLPKSIIAKEWIFGPLRPYIARIATACLRVLLFNIPVVFAETSYRLDYPWVKKSEIILNFPRLDLLWPSRNGQNSAKLVYIGLITPQRGLNVVLEALRLLTLEGRNLELELIGRIGVRDADLARCFAREHNLNVTIRGYLPLETACPIVNDCAIGLALLQPLPNYVDSYPTKIFDYMAMGVPVLSSDFPLYRSVVEDAQCGRCVDPTRPDLVSREIADMLGREGERRDMARRGLSVARNKYDWASQMLKLVEFYKATGARGTRSVFPVRESNVS